MSKLDDLRAYHRVQTFCLLTLTLLALGAALYLLRPVLVPFVFAVFLTYCLTPVIDAQRRHLQMPQGAGNHLHNDPGVGCVDALRIRRGDIRRQRSRKLDDYRKQS